MIFPKSLKSYSRQEDQCKGVLNNLYLQLLKKEMEENASLAKRLVEELGQGVLGIIRDNTISLAEKKLRLADLPERNLDAIMDNLWQHTEITHEYLIEIRTQNHLKLRITKCLFADEMKKHNAGEIGEAFYCAYDYGFCHGLNPDISFSRSKTLMMGHDCCDHSYSLI